MTLDIRYFLTLAVLVQLTTQNANFSSVCSPDEIEFQNKYCNGTVIANDNYSTEFFGKCSNDVDENEEEYCQYRRNSKCEESLNCLSDIVTRCCIDYYKDNLPPELYVIELYNQKMKQIKEMAQILDPIFYTILGILFVVGILTNGLLAIIFKRHESARNDMMLINLVVADILCLTVAMALVILREAHEINGYFEVFHHTYDLCLFISQYSLVMISFNRYRAVVNKTVLKTEKTHPNWVKITCFWVLGSFYVILNKCLEYIPTADNDIGIGILYFKVNYISLYLSTVIEGVIPVILITVFCVVASNRLKKLTKNFPGERSQNLQRIKNRYGAAKALIAVVILFVLSYVPLNITSIILSNYYINTDSFLKHIFPYYRIWYFLNKFTQCTMLLNSAFNPLVLYFLSSKFRRYFKAYVCFRTRDLD